MLTHLFTLSLDSYAKDPSVVRRLAGSSKEQDVERGFREKQGRHFIVRFEGGASAEIGYLISILLEEAYYKIGSDIGYYPEDKIGAVLYSKEQFRDVTRSPAWTGAVYDGRIKIPAGGLTTRTAAYAFSLSATEYIINEFGVAAVRLIFEGLAKGMGLDEAISSALHLSYDYLQEIWMLSLKNKL